MKYYRKTRPNKPLPSTQALNNNWISASPKMTIIEDIIRILENGRMAPEILRQLDNPMKNFAFYCAVLACGERTFFLPNFPADIYHGS